MFWGDKEYKCKRRGGEIKKWSLFRSEKAQCLSFPPMYGLVLKFSFRFFLFFCINYIYKYGGVELLCKLKLLRISFAEVVWNKTQNWHVPALCSNMKSFVCRLLTLIHVLDTPKRKEEKILLFSFLALCRFIIFISTLLFFFNHFWPVMYFLLLLLPLSDSYLTDFSSYKAILKIICFTFVFNVFSFTSQSLSFDTNLVSFPTLRRALDFCVRFSSSPEYF